MVAVAPRPWDNMMKKSQVLATLVMLGLCSSSTFVHAGSASIQLISVSGKVLVNSGKGFMQAKGTANLKPGDSVFLADGAIATVQFNGCSVALQSARVTQITDETMCEFANMDNRISSHLRGTELDVVITPTNGTYIPAGPAPVSGLISPYAIAGGIFAISAAAFTQAILEKETPVTAP
jgi:hypothetical protein